MQKTTALELPGRQKPYVMAHRGNRVMFAENTLAAFQQALADGADILETDLHLTSDGVFMCIHDATVDRTTGGRGAVAEMTLAQIKQLNAAARRPGLAAQQVPTLAELAAILPPDRAIALELKTDRFVEADICHRLAAELERTGIRARSVVLSFSTQRIQAVKSAAPDIPIGLISMSRLWPYPGAELLGPFWPLTLLNPLFVRMAHARGQVVCPLDPAPDSRLWYYRLLGCDAVISDNPQATVKRLSK